MHLNPGMTIAAAIAAMQREREALGTAIAVLQALIAGGVSPTVALGAPDGGGATITSATAGYARRGGKRPSIGQASIEILREAGRPMHGLRDLVPALEARGVKMKHTAGLATILLRTKEIVRTAPGTYAMKGGAVGMG